MRRVASLLLAAGLLACSPPPPKEVAQTKPKQDGVVETYRAWVLDQADSFTSAAGRFAAAVASGDRELAKKLYAPSRMFYERIEPVAEALGDLDPRLDAREGDVDSTNWTGYHRIEKILWSTKPMEAAKTDATTLTEDAKLLRAKIETAEITVPGLVAGAVELLNEVSSSKVTGEEERYSHTDLWDFQANVEGAGQIWTVLKPGMSTVDPDLSQKIDGRFAALQTLLDAQRRGEGFALYTEVDPKDVKALSAAVDALAEALADLGRHYTE